MAATLSRKSLKLPRLRMKDELLKSVPELGRLLGEESYDDRATSPYDHGQTAGAASPTRGGVISSQPFVEELTEEEELRIELEAVKRERAALMVSLAQIKRDEGKAGGELQQDDIRRLRKEMELKKEKLNELRLESTRLEGHIARLSVTSRDCSKLMPDGQPDAQARVQQLQEEMAVLDEELIEAEAKNRLYTLLGERTRREHMAMEKKVREARDMQENYMEDYATLTQHMHDMRAAKEDAERDLAHLKQMCTESKKDWARKLKDRRREVRDMERRQNKEKDREERKKVKAMERERIEKERQAKAKMEEEAYDMQLQALQPKLEAMEASWYRLHTISGADTPEEVIAYWEGLRSKEENMRELVRLAEVREARAKEEMAALLSARSNMFESSAPPGEAEAADYATFEMQIDDAKRRKAVAKKKFNKLRSVCIGAQQGLRSVYGRLESALADAEAQRSGSSSRRLTKSNSSSGSRSSSMNRRTGSFKQGKAPPPAIPEAAAAASLAASPSKADDGQGNTIDDADFFPDLPGVLKDVADRLNRLLALEQQMNNVLAATPEDGAEHTGHTPRDSELALMKGFHRRTWTGPAWIAAVTEQGQIMPSGVDLKRKKGKKKLDGPKPDLSRILGYTGSDMDSEASSDKDSDADSKAAGEGEWDGVIDRAFIKHRSMKMTFKHDPNRMHTTTMTSPVPTGTLKAT
ncbi:hypothetical protein WJX72_001158 [[Myrmecia] bisecta]|uniref:Uncharacterized protein n=1 Tax=[Myrmecia] bisecta TaxID=41462 RepID=A0AAW1PFN6_9CHLO